jgi:hypothetical protein
MIGKKVKFYKYDNKEKIYTGVVMDKILNGSQSTHYYMIKVSEEYSKDFSTPIFIIPCNKIYDVIEDDIKV